jgi:subtilase family serine protease
MYPPIVYSTITPDGTAGPVGITPTQMRHAYAIDRVTFQSGTIPGNGAGQTIAIIDAYDDPKLLSSSDPNFGSSDLHKFDVALGIPDPPSFQKLQPNGTPTTDSGWIGETALDVEWAHAIAPAASIDLVEALTSSDSNIDNAIKYARSIVGVSVVSMSFGGGEFAGEASGDSIYTTPSGHTGITFIASAGDTGAPAEYPASSPNVLGVGGTTLSIDSSGNYLSESAWFGSGGGASAFEPLPSYQDGVAGSNTHRMTPDVAFDASPSSGVPVYDSYNNGASAPWSQIGGTSLSSPCWAGLIAIFNQGRVAAGLGTLDGPSQTLPMLYSMPSDVFHDVTAGTSRGTPRITATAGYDLVTGLGTPIANRMAANFVSTGNIVVTGTASDDSIYLQRQGNYLAEWINSATPGVGTPSQLDLLLGATSLTIHGGGGTDSITLDQSNGNVLAASNQLDDAGGSAALSMIGSTGSDTISIDSTQDTYTFNSSQLSFANVSSLVFNDNAGSDVITCDGPIPVTLQIAGSDSINVNGGTVTLEFV